MARLKGGKYLIDLGSIDDGDDVTLKFPKELVEELSNSVDENDYFRDDIVSYLKEFEFTFFLEDDAYTYKGIPVIELYDDKSEIDLKINSLDLTASDEYATLIQHKFSITTSGGVITIIYRIIRKDVELHV